MKNGETRFAQIKVNMTSNLVNPSNPIINSLDSSYPLQLFFLDDGVRLGERSTAERLVVERAVVRLRQPVRGAERPPQRHSNLALSLTFLWHRPHLSTTFAGASPEESDGFATEDTAPAATFRISASTSTSATDGANVSGNSLRQRSR